MGDKMCWKNISFSDHCHQQSKRMHQSQSLEIKVGLATELSPKQVLNWNQKEWESWTITETPLIPQSNVWLQHLQAETSYPWYAFLLRCIFSKIFSLSSRQFTVPWFTPWNNPETSFCMKGNLDMYSITATKYTPSGNGNSACWTRQKLTWNPPNCPTHSKTSVVWSVNPQHQKFSSTASLLQSYTSCWSSSATAHR